MFALFKKRNAYQAAAYEAYINISAHIREPVFYDECGVPDTFDGRFDLLLVHIFAVMEAMLDHGPAGEVYNQALFDATFSNMDQVLREMGIGDMGIPKHMRRMMKAFNGRMHVYSKARKKGDLSKALSRNLYGTVKDVEKGQVAKFADYLEDSIKRLEKREFDDLLSGKALFEVPS